jgi:hypothetical protein
MSASWKRRKTDYLFDSSIEPQPRAYELCQDSNTIASDSYYRHVFIIEARDSWQSARPHYNPVRDLVLTYDFGLHHDLQALGGTSRYVDHLCEQAVMQDNNYRIYKFFRDWHFDAEGADIFRYRGVEFGFSFRIEIWNDFTFYVRSRLCLEQLRSINFETVIVGSGQGLMEDLLGDMGIAFNVLPTIAASQHTAYLFPIHRWIDERLRIRRMRHVIRDLAMTVQGIAMSYFDRLAEVYAPKKRVYVQEYHPTRALMHLLQRQPGLRILQGHFSATPSFFKFLRERPIPVYGSKKKYQAKASELLGALKRRRMARLVLSTGVDVTDAVNRLIEQRISSVLPESLRTLDCVIRYLDRHPIKLEILIANVGQFAMLLDSVARSRGVPSYLIINGMLGNDYLDESKYATVINAYSPSIRDHYFRGMSNIVCLGDPRMDDYANAPARIIDRVTPTITIGVSGFSTVDLNSYLAVEFEFLYQVLKAIANVAQQGSQLRVILKVRANGYSHLYRQFINEYFPGRVDCIEDQVPMRTVLDETDFYISIYSQTLFEASCLGIPCVYHKNDREIIDPPFDGKSELVTTYNVVDLEQAILDCLAGSSRFDAFLERSVMEKYIGPLDGGNLERNLDFVRQLLKQHDVSSAY